MFQIVCETCKKVITSSDSISEATETARFEEDANCHEESGDWTCAECYAKYMNEMMGEARIYSAEKQARDYMLAMDADPLGAYLRAKGERED